MAEYQLRQIRISDDLYRRIRNHCNIRNITLTAFYDEMLRKFINKVQDNASIVYHASFKNGRLLSLWIRKEILVKLQDLGRQARVADARVIYTALMDCVENIH